MLTNAMVYFLRFNLDCTTKQTLSVRTFWPAPARTSHKNRNVRRTHPQAMFCARTRTFFLKKIPKKFFLAL